jgi:N-carbamoyl-L-amino-acid hydrolase
MTITISELNQCDAAAFVAALEGIYEHSPWIPERNAAKRPFADLNALKVALQKTLATATIGEKVALIRAHPELAGKAAIAGTLSKESTGEQASVGLNLCSEEQYATLHQLNRDYNAKFDFPFVLAVRGADGNGLTREAIIEIFQTRLQHGYADEMAECLHQIDRIASFRLRDLCAAAA